MTNVLLKTINLSKAFSDKTVLDNVSIPIIEGRNLAIIGRSGEGKSVLLKCILGLIEPDKGQILYEDTVMTRETKDKLFKNLGILFQGSALFDSLQVWENISFQFKYNGYTSRRDRKKLATEKLRLVGLTDDIAELFPAELSGGMQKRVGIARAIATDPKILFFDEPTSGLDPIMSNVINKLIRKIVKELGATAVTISHDLNSVKMIADDVALLKKGAIVWQGTINEFRHTEDANIKEFVKAF